MVHHSGVNSTCDHTATTMCYDCGPQQFFCDDHIKTFYSKSSICHLFARHFHTYFLVVYIVILIHLGWTNSSHMLSYWQMQTYNICLRS